MRQRPRVLDLYCGAGGSAVGYHRAGFDLVGIDIKDQPNYPFEFIKQDAIVFLCRFHHFVGGSADLQPELCDHCGKHYDEFCHYSSFDAVHASPPCQFGTTLKARWKDKAHPNLIAKTRSIIEKTELPYIIENVEGARRELRNPFMLCGTMFNLGTADGNQLRRHRYFEAPWLTAMIQPCAHNRVSAIGVYGGGQHPLARARVPVTIGVYGNAGGQSKRDGDKRFGTDARKEAMGIDWMNGKELTQAIPPAYTEFIGQHLMEVIMEPSK